MTSNGKNVAVLAGVALPASIGCLAYLGVAGTSDENLRTVLTLTARLSFLIYLAIFVARPLAQIAPSRPTGRLLRERRSLGVAFAAMHTVHLGLIAYRYSTVPGLDYPLVDALFGGTAYAFIYLMLITSFDRPARAIGRTAWRRLHKAGLYYVGFIFIATLLPEPGEPVYTLERAWIVTLTGLAVFVRLTAWFARRQRA